MGELRSGPNGNYKSTINDTIKPRGIYTPESKYSNVFIRFKIAYWLMSSRSISAGSIKSMYGSASIPSKPGWIPQSSCQKIENCISLFYRSFDLDPPSVKGLLNN